MKSLLSLLILAIVFLSGCKATFWYSPSVSFHKTELPEAKTVSISMNSGKITLENAQSNSLTEIRSKGKNQFEWNQHSDTLFIKIQATNKNEFELRLGTDQKIELTSLNSRINVVQMANSMKITSQNSRLRLDQPPKDLEINSSVDSVFVGLKPEIKYNHKIELTSSFFRLIKNGNETDIHEFDDDQQDSLNSVNIGIRILNFEDSAIDIKSVGLIW